MTVNVVRHQVSSIREHLLAVKVVSNVKQLPGFTNIEGEGWRFVHCTPKALQSCAVVPLKRGVKDPRLLGGGVWLAFLNHVEKKVRMGSQKLTVGLKILSSDDEGDICQGHEIQAELCFVGSLPVGRWCNCRHIDISAHRLKSYIGIYI